MSLLVHFHPPSEMVSEQIAMAEVQHKQDVTLTPPCSPSVCDDDDAGRRGGREGKGWSDPP